MARLGRPRNPNPTASLSRKVLVFNVTSLEMIGTEFVDVNPIEGGIKVIPVKVQAGRHKILGNRAISLQGKEYGLHDGDVLTGVKAEDGSIEFRKNGDS